MSGSDVPPGVTPVLPRKRVVLAYVTGAVDRSMIQEDVVRFTPLGLLYLFASLQYNGIDTGVYSSIDNDNCDHILDRIMRWNPEIVGFTVFTFNNIFVDIISKRLRERFPHVKIILGGPLASAAHEEIMQKSSHIDAVFRGEAEEGILEIVQSRFMPDRLIRVRGLTWRYPGSVEQNHYFINSPAPINSDLDSLPAPIDYGAEYNHIMTSRGCFGDCSFCSVPNMSGRHIRFRSPELVVDEIEKIHKNGVSFFKIMDDTFCVDEVRTIEMCKRIVERNLKIEWEAMSRVDMVDPVTLRGMRSAGCTHISYGVESGSTELRKSVNKAFTSEKVIDAFRSTRRAGIHPSMFLIYFGDMETPWTVLCSMAIVLACRPKKVFMCSLTLHPGTQMFQDAKKKGIIEGKSWRVGPQFYPFGKIWLAKTISYFIRIYNYISCGSKEKILS